VLPVENTLIYVEPIYIQAAEARMPQLKKVVLAMGNKLIYRDTYEEALAELASVSGFARGSPRPAETPAEAAARPAEAPRVDSRLEAIRDHLRRYRALAADGKWADAGKELEEIERLAGGQGR
jgi:uncharacterized membrane protein (UPF0182 family)